MTDLTAAFPDYANAPKKNFALSSHSLYMCSYEAYNKQQLFPKSHQYVGNSKADMLCYRYGRSLKFYMNINFRLQNVKTHLI